MKYRFYKWYDQQKRYVTDGSRGGVRTSNPERADLLTEADWLAWGESRGFERETMLTNEQLSEIKARAEAATPLINEREPHVTGKGGIVLLYGPFPMDKAQIIAGFYRSTRADIPLLLAEIERLRQYEKGA